MGYPVHREPSPEAAGPNTTHWQALGSGWQVMTVHVQMLAPFMALLLPLRLGTRFTLSGSTLRGIDLHYKDDAALNA